MKILITGISGFTGSHLAEYFINQGQDEIHGTIRWRSDLQNIAHIRRNVVLHECDITDASAMKSVILQVKPDQIFHLAAQSYVPFSWRAPHQTLSTNILGELNLFEALRQTKMGSPVHIAGSSEEYGLVFPDEIPIKETNALRPLSPYGVSKVAQDLLGFQYFKSYGLPIIRTRAFNHEGPRRGEVFVTSTFSKQIVEIEKGKKDPVIHVGNLNAVRDYLDVRDVVRAYALALSKGSPGEVYNICSGEGIKIEDMLNRLLSFSRVKVRIEKDQTRMRPSDVELLVGSSDKFRQATGWKPEIPFMQTLQDMLDYWRARIS